MRILGRHGWGWHDLNPPMLIVIGGFSPANISIVFTGIRNGDNSIFDLSLSFPFFDHRSEFELKLAASPVLHSNHPVRHIVHAHIAHFF